LLEKWYADIHFRYSLLLVKVTEAINVRLEKLNGRIRFQKDKQALSLALAGTTNMRKRVTTWLPAYPYLLIAFG